MSGDKEVWALYAKGVKRTKVVKRVGILDGSARGPSPSHPASPSGLRRTGSSLSRGAGDGLQDAARFVKKPKVAVDPQDVTLGKKAERGMRDGSFEIEGKIDLHGMRQNEAHEALMRFIAARMAQGQRRLLVITGKGKQGEAVLRAALPRWCNEEPLRDVVMALKPAAAKHGGGGAWYVVLRRVKPSAFES